jgi:chorismate mutase
MEINEWRIRIDELNDELVALLNKRASYAVEIGKIKKQKGLPVFDDGREQAVLNVIAEKAKKANGPLSEDSFKKIFQVIMEETRKVEE